MGPGTLDGELDLKGSQGRFALIMRVLFKTVLEGRQHLKYLGRMELTQLSLLNSPLKHASPMLPRP